MQKRLLLSFSGILWACWIGAQVPPLACDPPGQLNPSENYQSVCVSCNFAVSSDTGSTIGALQDPAPPFFCSTVENDQWYSFIAGYEADSIVIEPFNCSQSNGLQIAVFSDFNAEPIACNMGCVGCGSIPLGIEMTNLIPGKTYYLMVDGYDGDECDFIIKPSIYHTGLPPSWGPVTPISGPASFPPGGTTSYRIDPVYGAGYYKWTSTTPGVLFNGQPGPAYLSAPGGKEADVTFPAGIIGSVQFCVQPVNACAETTQRCKTVGVSPIVPTVLPKIEVCYEDQPYTFPWGGQEPGQPGSNQHTYITSQGYDSIVIQPLVLLPPIITYRTRYICTGSCETICGVEYCTQGLYTETCTSWQGCDSTIYLTLNVLSPIAEITGNTVLDCLYPELTLGSAVSPNFPGVSLKKWYNSEGMLLGTGNQMVVDTPGVYVLVTTMSAGGTNCAQSDTVIVTSNFPNVPLSILIQGDTLTKNHLIALLSAISNAPLASYLWTGPMGYESTDSLIEVNKPGWYSLTVADTLGCTANDIFKVIKKPLQTLGFNELSKPGNTPVNGGGKGDLSPEKTEVAIHWSVSPNPGNGVFYLHHQQEKPLVAALSLIDIAGREIWQLNPQIFVDNTRLNWTQIPAGQYWLQVKFEGKVQLIQINIVR